MAKKTNNPEKKDRSRLTRALFLIFLCGLVVSFVVLTVSGLVSGSIAGTSALWLSILTGAFLLASFVLAARTIRKAKEITPMRFNLTGKGLHNAKSEPQFLADLEKTAPYDLNHSALVSFSIYHLKKEAVNQLGYKTGAEVPEIVFGVIEENLAELPSSIFGYDFNENILLYFRFSDEIDIKPRLTKIKDDIRERLEKNALQIGRDLVFGVYFNNDNTLAPEEMLRRCLLATDYGNYNDRTGVVVYDKQAMENAGTNDLPLYEEIVQGLDRHEFELYYQPKFDLRLNRFCGAEALIRWRHPKKGILSPASFIPFAEQSELIIRLDRYVFEMACQDIAAWKTRGERLLPISINLSRKSIFKTDLIDFMTQTIARFKVNPLLIEMEITESATAKDSLFTLSVLKQIQLLNIKVAVDDFGTGYSSMSSLRRMPVDTIKIDKSFLDDIEIDAKSREVVKAIIKLAHALEMTALAEGIQSKKQVQILKDQLGCDVIQGYYYSRPIPNDEYISFIKKNKFEGKAD